MSKTPLQISFRVYDFKDDITSRVNKTITTHQIGHRDLERYYTLLNLALKEVALTQNECLCILDVLKWRSFNIEFIRFIWATLEDNFKYERTDKKYNIDGKLLINKIKNSSAAFLYALADAVERYWNDVTIETDAIAKLKEVGFYIENDNKKK